MELERKAGIYKITNLINNKIYVGSTVNLRKRKNEHFLELRKNAHFNNYLQKSFNKHGADNFKFEILELCENTTLINRESFYIQKLKSFDKAKGYNLIDPKSPGVNSKSKKLYQFDLHGNLIREYASIREAARQLNIPRRNLKSGIDKPLLRRNSLWSKDNFINKLPTIGSNSINTSKGKVKSVIQLSLNNEELTKFNSINSASKQTNINATNISQVCTGSKKTAGGYKWKYAD